ncbi:MAG TPA: DUF3040 domain-containing protein [Blastococcus sp.]|nr:DUF3040 domain-containing protein [Blastococcus sp.]
MLSDREQRALEELERSFELESRETASSRRSSRPPGLRSLAVLGCPAVVLLFLGAVVAALALASAAGIGWLSWRLWARGGLAGAAAEWGTGRRLARRAGESVRRFLRWLSEAA